MSNLVEAAKYVRNAVKSISAQPKLHVENSKLKELLKFHTEMFSDKDPIDTYRRRVAEEMVLNSIRHQSEVLEQADTGDVGIGEVPALLAEIIPEVVHDALVPRISNVHMVNTVTGKIRKKGAQLATTKSDTTEGDDARDLETVDADYSLHTELAEDIGEIKQDASFVDYDCETRMLRYAYSIEAGIGGPKELGEDTLADGLREATDRITLEIDAAAIEAILASEHAGNVQYSEEPEGTAADWPSEIAAHDKLFLKKLEEAALLIMAKQGLRPNVLLAGSTIVKILGSLTDKQFKLLDDNVLGIMQGDNTLAIPIGTLATRLGIWTVIYVPFMEATRGIVQVVTTKRGKRQSGLDYFVFQSLFSTPSVLNTTDGSYSALALTIVDIVVGEPNMFATIEITSS